MQGYNVIAIYNKSIDKLLMCKRKKNPYKGLSNFIGGKIEIGETSEEAAYRELFEETSILKNDTNLIHLMDFTYFLSDCYVEVYVGKLNKDIFVSGDENELYWSSLNCDFFNKSKYAGEGNIGHVIEQINLSKDKIFGY